MRRPKRTPVRPTLAHGIMVLTGLVTFVLVTAALRDRDATVQVVVAAAPVEAGTPVEAAALTTATVDAGSTLVGSLLRDGDLAAGSSVARRLAPGEPVLPADLVPSGAADGRRTLALPVERMVVEGLGLRTGDRVDVIGVDRDGEPAFVATDVEVARLPGESPLGLGRSADTAGTWLTVSVSESQALDLAAAGAVGQVVVVRSTGAAPVGAGVAAGSATGPTADDRTRRAADPGVEPGDDGSRG